MTSFEVNSLPLNFNDLNLTTTEMNIKQLLSSTFVITFISISSFAQSSCLSISSHCFNASASDGSGNGKNGTSVGNPVYTIDRNGKPSSAMLFDGINDNVELPTGTDYALDNVTYACWVYVNQLPNSGTSNSIIAVGNAGGDVHILLNNHPRFGFYGFSAGCYNRIGGAFRSITGTMPQLNQWYHLALTRTNESVSLYVNGVLNGTTTFTSSKPNYSTPVEALIGRRHTNQQFFNGKIDDVRFYDCAKTAAEIANIYKLYSCNDTCKYSVTTYDTITVRDTVLVMKYDTITIYDTIIVRDTIIIGVDDSKQNENKIYVFPIPSNDKVTIDLSEYKQDVQFDLYDVYGRVLDSGSLGSVSSFSIQLPMTAGQYILRVSEEGETILNSRLIKQ